MVFFNYSTMQMTAKIVYYGPGLCGKTTNLRTIYERTTNDSRGEMVSLETETDRTLFFDLLPLEVGSVAGFRTRLQLYTVPGQVFYNTTRKLVLKGVDGVVFVADSQRAMLDANVDSLKNLEENLAEMSIELRKLPVVLQYNKRDLDDLSSVHDLNQVLNINNWPAFEASALSGHGVFDTLKEVSKLTLVALKRRLARSKSSRPGPRPGARPGTTAASAAAAARLAAENRNAPEQPNAPGQPNAPTTAQSQARTLQAAPVKQSPAPQSPAPQSPANQSPANHPQKATTPAQTAKPGAPRQVTVRPSATPQPVGRTRGGVDALAELEKLRQRALDSALKGGAATNGRKELHRELQVAVSPEQLRRIRRLMLSFQLEDQAHEVVHSVEDFEVDLEASSGDRLVLRLNISLNPRD